MLDISKGKVTLVLVPWDLRAGYYKLAQTAKFTLHIDVEKAVIGLFLYLSIVTLQRLSIQMQKVMS